MTILNEYRKTLTECIQMYIPISKEELDPILDYSINKRYYESNCKVINNYTKKTANMTLLALADYINSRQPIVTAHGTMFMKHADCPNPMAQVIQLFLDKRGEDKKMMFKFPKGSEEFEKYNLLQSLDKIDANGIYGVLGMYTSLLFDINVSTSITSQGRALVSSASMMFESFLANNIKFGSINEVLEFINHICKEERRYNDYLILDRFANINDTFVKIIDSCGYRWIPDENEMEIIWRVINNLSQTDLNRVYYKNNLYEFLNNSSMINAIKTIIKDLKNPFFNSLKVPKEIHAQLEEFAYIIKEYVYYGKMYIDRIDRCDNIMKSVIMISDTDSTIISLDAWYRFALNVVKDEDLNILKYDPINVINIFKKDEFDDFENLSDISSIYFEEPEESYDFENDKIIESIHLANPLIMYPQDYLRYSIINIMAYILDILINDYMEQFTKNNHSWAPDKPCKILMKNEFTFTRVLMTYVKKAYASIMAVQEGNIIPKGEQLDIKGIASMAKSSMSESTRKQLQKILMEDILEAPTIDQFKIIEDLAILERKIVNSIQSGSKEYYKPVTIKSINNYENPMRIQGIKASTVWNQLKTDDLPGINLEERNAVDIAKVVITSKTVDKLKDKFPSVYENALELLNNDVYNGKIDSIAIPLDVSVPEWVMEMIDYNLIVNDNISGFPYDSVGIVKLSSNTNYSNILQL